MIRWAGVLMLAVLCAGCVTQHQLPPSTVAAFGFAGASARTTPDAVLNDTAIETAAATAAGIDPRDGAAALAFAASPAGKAAVSQRVSDLVASAFDKTLRPQLVGPRPVRVEVAIWTFDVPSAVRRALIGGNYVARAVVTIRDGVTGDVILASPPFYATVTAGQGLLGVSLEAAMSGGSGASETSVKLAESLAAEYAKWLLRR
jgi:hypothetical protein